MDSTVRSEWHSIRPWSSDPRLRPRLALLVREITSVSATFILSTGDPEPSLASLGLTPDEEDDEEDDDEFLETKKRASLSDALAKGLSVNVNGAQWQRVLIRIDDKTDEAVIIIYGLMPGRQYDIDLGLVQGGQNNSVRQQVITEDSDRTMTDSNQSEEPSNPNHTAVASDSAPSTFTPSMRDAPNPPPPNGPHCLSRSNSFTLEDRHKQLQHSLSLLTSERDTLTTSLKSARRDAQKADAALRSEIDILKRASEKNTATEHRARQKVLALQESVKRAQIATREMEQQASEVEGVLPSLKEKRDVNEQLYITVKEDVEQARQERDKAAEMDGKRIEGMKGELTSLGNKLERVSGKREKVEGAIPDLEEQLKEIEKEIENVEAEALGYNSEGREGGTDSFEGPEIVSDSMPVHHPPAQRRHRPQSQHLPGTIGRPSPPTPIQRPSHVSTASHHPLPTQQPHHRSSFIPQQPHWQLPGKSPTQPQVPPNAYAQLMASDPSTQASTLSSRAPPFEPSRGFTRMYRTSSSSMPESGPPPAAGHTGVSPTLQRPIAPRLMGGNAAWAGMTGS